MKPLAAGACARLLTAPSTMTLLEQPNYASCAINCRIHRSLWSGHGRVRRRVNRPATFTLDTLVGTLAARPTASFGSARAPIGRARTCFKEKDKGRSL
jgi:hypothetical protein